jgi:hypothetical protein
MKTISKLRVLTVLLMLSMITRAFAAEVTPVTTIIRTNAPSTDAQTEILINRLKEIRDMDKSNLSRTNKKELRKEIRAIKSTLKASRGGLYISVGAAIIIVLLLILIL